MQHYSSTKGSSEQLNEHEMQYLSFLEVNNKEQYLIKPVPSKYQSNMFVTIKQKKSIEIRTRL